LSLNALVYLDGLVSHALSLGYFERVNTHEPKSAPGPGLTVALWAQELIPIPILSGLAVTAGRLVFTGRVMQNALMQPPDMIDPRMIEAVDAWMAALTGDFTLGSTLMEVDLLGSYGEPLFARAGYLNQDGKIFRVFDVNIPLIISDLWTQAA
jgi:hypothetical protein